MGRGGGPKIEAIKFAETEMVQTQDAGVAAPVKGLLRRLPLQEWAQAAAEGVPQFLRDAVAAELLVGDRGQKRAAESGLELREADRGQTPDRRPLLGETDRDPAVVSRGLPEAAQRQGQPQVGPAVRLCPEIFCFCVSHNTSSASNFVYILLCQLQIQLDDNGSNSLRNLCGEYRGQVPPHLEMH